MDLILKAALGAAVVLILAALAKTRNYYIAGLVPLFPTFALIAHYIVGKGRSVDDFEDHHPVRDVVDHSVLCVFGDALRAGRSPAPGSLFSRSSASVVDGSDCSGQRLGTPADLTHHNQMRQELAP